MTEAEAKLKWCPHASADKSHHSGEHCITSECMGWRWNDKKDVGDPDRQGHCGMSGDEV